MATIFEGSGGAITSGSTAPIADPRSGRGAALPGPQRSDGERSEAERSGGPGNAEGGTTASPDDPEVLERPSRRRFTAEHKRRILREVDACSRGEVAALLRREGLYSSHIAAWRRERERGELEALASKKRGPKTTHDPALLAETKRLRRENQRLQRRLRQAELCLEIQKKASEILGIPLSPLDGDESE